MGIGRFIEYKEQCFNPVLCLQHMESLLYGSEYSIICMFRKLSKNIVPFSEIIFVLLQAYLLIPYFRNTII